MKTGNTVDEYGRRKVSVIANIFNINFAYLYKHIF